MTQEIESLSLSIKEMLDGSSRARASGDLPRANMYKQYAVLLIKELQARILPMVNEEYYYVNQEANQNKRFAVKVVE